MAVLGDVDQFVPMGKKRVPALTDDGEIHLTVAFANGETARVIKGYSPFIPAAKATDGGIGRVQYDAATQQFQIPVMPGIDGTASILIQRWHAGPGQPDRPRSKGHRETNQAGDPTGSAR
jgi:hypothetical protein